MAHRVTEDDIPCCKHCQVSAALSDVETIKVQTKTGETIEKKAIRIGCDYYDPAEAAYFVIFAVDSSISQCRCPTVRQVFNNNPDLLEQWKKCSY